MIEIIKLDQSRIHDYLNLLKQLSPQAFIGDFTLGYVLRALTNEGTKDIYLAVMDDTSKAVGTVSIQYESKANRPPIHSYQATSYVAHIEDVVVDAEFRRRGIGKSLVAFAMEKAADIGCYKVVLDCDEKNIPFYLSCGLKLHGVHMRQDIEPKPQKATEPH